MSLRYTFGRLFYGGKIQKERLYKVLEDLDGANTGEGTDISSIKQAIGKASGEGAGGILKDVADLKTAVGSADTDDGSLKKRCKSLETAIGSADTDDGSLKKRCKSIETAIGDEETSGTILYRIKQLEDAE